MTVCLLLAAGSASRMGQPKMLLPFKGKTLLQHAIDEIQQVRGCSIVAVTGCYHSLLKVILEQQQVDSIENKNWEEGMGASIQKGIKHIVANHPNADSVIVLVCDQPYISSSLLRQLVLTQQQTGNGIIASSYNNTMGTPVLFSKKYFDQLSGLNGQAGAKKIIQQYLGDTAAVPFPGGEIDIDSPEDYEFLKNSTGI